MLTNATFYLMISLLNFQSNAVAVTTVPISCNIDECMEICIKAGEAAKNNYDGRTMWVNYSCFPTSKME